MNFIDNTPHPPSPNESLATVASRPVVSESNLRPPWTGLNREELRFLADVAARPLSTTVSRYQRLHLSRRRGNAIRQDLVSARVIEPIAIATRSGQVVLYGLTEVGRATCAATGIDPGSVPRASLEHGFWVAKAAEQFERHGYEVTREHVIAGNGVVDVVATRPGQRVAIEVETGKSDIAANLSKLQARDFDRIVLLATSPAAIAACERAIQRLGDASKVELQTWLDVS